MRFLLVLISTIVTALALSATPAMAADSTCNIHSLNINGWSIQTDDVDTDWAFQCGGANNEHWAVILSLQWKDSSGVWHKFDCDNGLPCQVARPTQGDYAGGTLHGDTNHWNIAGQLNCHDIRFHAQVVFYGGSPDKPYNSATSHVGC